MIIDKTLEFSDNQALTAAGPSTDSIDLGGNFNIGVGRPMFVVVIADASPAAAVTASIESASDSAFTTPETLGSVTIPAGAAAGSRYVLGFPYNNLRYLRMNYSAAGTFTSYLTDQEPADWQAYPGVTGG